MNDLGRLLRTWCRAEAPPEGAPAIARRVGPLDGIATLAHHHRVEGIAHRGLAGLAESAPARDATLLAAAHQVALAEHLRAVATVRRVGRAFDAAAVPWVVVKGPVLAEHAYRDPTLRRAADVDVVVPRARFVDAFDALETAGAHWLHEDWVDALAAGAGEVDVRLGDDPRVDLHWHVLTRREERLRFKVPIDELLERAVEVTLGRSTPVRTFEPTDTTIHLALHACLAGAHKLGWLVDIDRHIRATPPDWSTLVARARAWDVGLPVALALGRATHAVGAPVPSDVVAALLPSRTCRMLLATIDALAPVGARQEGHGVAERVARHARPSPAAVAGAVCATGWHRAVARRTARDQPARPAARQRDAQVAWLAEIDGGAAA